MSALNSDADRHREPVSNPFTPLDPFSQPHVIHPSPVLEELFRILSIDSSIDMLERLRDILDRWPST